MATRRTPSLPQLGELEVRVLEFLWEAEEGDVLEVHGAVGRPRGISANTVGSALERLHRKHLTTRRKVSHAYRYRAAVGREVFYARRAVEAAGGLSALADEGLLAAFVDLVGDTDAGALDELERLIAGKRRRPKP